MKEIKQIVEEAVKNKPLHSFNNVYLIHAKSTIRYWLYGIFGILGILLFLPWTQNIRAKGAVTTLRQEQRPQELNSIIGGRIVKWFVKEGDFVKKGDTIAQLAEIKDNYLDPDLLPRTQEQIEAKSASINSYSEKVNATDAQIAAMDQARRLKLQQLQNKISQLTLKIVSDSMDVRAALNDFKIAEEQYRRQRVMRDSGLASMVQVEQRNQSYQNAMAKRVSAEIKLTNTKTDLTNARIELGQIEQEYAEKIYKAHGDKASAQSEIAAGKGELAKLSNQYSNYAIRSGQYYLIAPQSGQIVNASKAGINEILKDGEKLVDIVPELADYAVELYVRPVDVPLLTKGQDVRFLFDGYPAVVFSGWPEASYGTFAGKIIAVERTVNQNGMFRVLVGEDKTFKKWPATLRIGAGASAIALLNDVPIWYELWRNINGFAPDYYTPKELANDKKNK